MKNTVYVVANVATETILVVTADIETAYRMAYLAQQHGARKKDVSITPMKLDVQMGAEGTPMCYDDYEVCDALRDLAELDEDWDEDEDEDEEEDDWDEDEDEDEDEWNDEDEDEDEDEDFNDDETNCRIYNLFFGIGKRG